MSTPRTRAIAALGRRRSVLTDAERRPEDYGGLCVAAPARSLHYRQDDGSARAVDLRTLDRDEMRNTLGLYLEAMGFDTLRHEGTADHLRMGLGGR